MPLQQSAATAHNNNNNNNKNTQNVQKRVIRVCVLTPSYENSESKTKEWDSIIATPKHFFPDDFVEVEEVDSDKEEGEAAAAATTDNGSTETKKVVVGKDSSSSSSSSSPSSHRIRRETRYTFGYVELKKATVYRDLRPIIKSAQYDVFFNLCDGAKDEDRAGEEVVRTLEEFNVPFTGAASKYFELSKPDMKMMAHYCGIPTARHAVLEAKDLAEAELALESFSPSEPSLHIPPSTASASVVAAAQPQQNKKEDGEGSDASPSPSPSHIPPRLLAKCAHLRFPVIVKHVSGYASIGMTKENKCANMAALAERAAIFINEFDFALVEEFIVGDEATVLACADESQPGGIRVHHPVMVNFPKGCDFKHFELKWSDYGGMEWRMVPNDDPALPQIISIGRKSFKEMMGGIGYGRCDLRISRERNNEVVFLEINPNCGIMYPPGQEGSADYILQMEAAKRQREEEEKEKRGEEKATANATQNNNNDNTSPKPKIGEVDKLKGQRDFAILQIKTAIARCERSKPLWVRCYDGERDFHLRATRAIKKGTIVFHDEGRSVRLFTKPFVDANWSEEDKAVFAENAWPIGSSRSCGDGDGDSSDGGSGKKGRAGTAAHHHYFGVWDINPATWRTINNSKKSDGGGEEANLVFGPNRSLNIIAARDIAKGEELTMDYDTLAKESMPMPKAGK